MCAGRGERKWASGSVGDMPDGELVAGFCVCYGLSSKVGRLTRNDSSPDMFPKSFLLEVRGEEAE